MAFMDSGELRCPVAALIFIAVAHALWLLWQLNISIDL